MMENDFHLEIYCNSVNCNRERICGDNFVFRHIEGGRTVAVLADGLGHGIKANILSALTSSMLLNFIARGSDIRLIIPMVLKSLPVCSVRKISYSTFTIADIDSRTGKTLIVEYDNPRTMVFRGTQPIEMERRKEIIEGDSRSHVIHISESTLIRGDRIVMVSDGITQSGLGKEAHNFGWSRSKVESHISGVIAEDRGIGSYDLSYNILRSAIHKDELRPHDDMSAAVIWLREPRKLLLVSCPPSSDRYHTMLVRRVQQFDGKKVICGYPVAEIIARETRAEIIRSDQRADPDIPPSWQIEGFDLVTEGIVTLSKVCDILERSPSAEEIHGHGAAGELAGLLAGIDHVEILIGTKRRVQSSVYVPDEFELRRKILRRIGRVLREKYKKEVILNYI